MASEIFYDFAGKEVKISLTEYSRPWTRGAFGKIYFFATEMGDLAIKVCRRDPHLKSREIDIIRALQDHPQIVKVIAVSQTDESIAIVMEAMTCNLRQFLTRCFPLTRDKVFDVARQITTGLAYIHSKGIVHRDVKSDNILVKGDRVVICDFGSAKEIKSGDISISYICSRYYRAPELLMRATEYDYHVDFWSLGCIFYELIVNRPPFIGDNSLEMLVRIIQVLGTPTIDDYAQMKVKPLLLTVQKPKRRLFVHGDLFFDESFIRLISQMLSYDVRHRQISPSDL